MARQARIVVPGLPHHVTQRGNRRQDTFFCDEDYRAYLQILKDNAIRYNVRVLAYCLMPNHVHLILIPSTEESLTRAVAETHRRYTVRINTRNHWQGYLWQGRFSSGVMDEIHLLRATAYIERNPVKAGLVDSAEAWPWSSAADHIHGMMGGVAESRWLEERTEGWVCSWREYLHQEVARETADLMNLQNRPIGDSHFVQRISNLIGKKLTLRKQGRPLKKGTQ